MFVCVTGGERGIRTLDTLSTYTPLAGERFRPLSHLSEFLLSSTGIGTGSRTPRTCRASAGRDSVLIAFREVNPVTCMLAPGIQEIIRKLGACPRMGACPQMGTFPGIEGWPPEQGYRSDCGSLAVRARALMTRRSPYPAARRLFRSGYARRSLHGARQRPWAR